MPTERASRERQQIIAEAQAITEKMDDLAKKLTISQTQLQNQKRILKGLAIFIFFLTMAGIGLGLVAYQAHSTADNLSKLTNCTTDWANATSARSTTLTKLSTLRTDALDDLVRTLSLPPAETKKVFPTALQNYLEASDTYREAVTKNPIPEPPEFTCN